MLAGLQALWQTLQLLPLLNLFVTILAFETAIATTNLKFWVYCTFEATVVTFLMLLSLQLFQLMYTASERLFKADTSNN